MVCVAQHCICNDGFCLNEKPHHIWYGLISPDENGFQSNEDFSFAAKGLGLSAVA